MTTPINAAVIARSSSCHATSVRGPRRLMDFVSVASFCHIIAQASTHLLSRVNIELCVSFLPKKNYGRSRNQCDLSLLERGPVPRTPSYSGREFSVIRF